MRFIVLLLSIMFVSQVAQAQSMDQDLITTPAPKGAPRFRMNFVTNDTLFMRMYKNGIKYGDYNLAINAMQALYAQHPDSIKYLDSACIMYSETQQYAQCILSGNKVLQYRPDDIAVIEAVALSNQHVGRYPEALGLFQIEFEKNSSLYAAYQIAVLQYSLQKTGEAQATLDRIIADKRALKDKIGFSTNANTTQQVFYKAAAENLMGVIYQNLKDDVKAKASFQAALAIQPDYVMAQNNLDALEKKDGGK